MLPSLRLLVTTLLLATALFAAQPPPPRPPLVAVGTAKIDITPAEPVRLSGYRSREKPFERVGQPIFARALAIGADDQHPAVLLTVEVVGITEALTDEVAAALRASHRIERERLAICVIHTHTGPSLRNTIPYMFSVDLPEAEVAAIAAYTATLRDKLIAVARAALADRRPGHLAWNEGRAGFAAQRREIVAGKWRTFGLVPNGYTDNALPLLRVTDANGQLRAVFLSYACHGTTLVGTDNFVHPDWAGDAAARLESAHPGAIALVALGCGADANPHPRGSLENVATHGRTIAEEVERLLKASLRPLGPVTEARHRQIDLAFDRAVTREELTERAAKKSNITASYAAQKFLQRLDAGQSLPTAVPYRIQTWSFGNDLAMVFLAGEVVSEYSLRLRRELDARRLWVNAYANDVPCYIASERMFPEGGYEVDGSMDFYAWPTRLARGTEDQIIGAVRALVPPAYLAKEAAR